MTVDCIANITEASSPHPATGIITSEETSLLHQIDGIVKGVETSSPQPTNGAVQTEEPSSPHITNGLVKNGEVAKDSIVNGGSEGDGLVESRPLEIEKPKHGSPPNNGKMSSKVLSEADSGADTSEAIGSNTGKPVVDDEWKTIPHQENGSGWVTADGTPVPADAGGKQPSTTPKKHTFYFIRIPRTIDEKLRNDIRSAELNLDQMIKKRDVHKVGMQEKKSQKAQLLEKLRPVREKERACWAAIQGKRSELEPFSSALNKFRSVQSNVRGRGQDVCSSEEELNERIAELEYRIQHESIPLKEEKQLLRDIKQLESTRSQVCANSILQQELIRSLGPKEDIQDQYKFLLQDIDGIKKEHSLACTECDNIEKEIEKLNKGIEELRQLYDKANMAQQDAFAALRELKKQETAKNDPFFQNKRDLQTAKEFVMQKKVEELDSLCSKNIESFMALWNGDDKFRLEYMKNNERSTVRRLETLDGRSLGPGEKAPQIKDDDYLLPGSAGVRTTIAEQPIPAKSAPEKASKSAGSAVQLSKNAPSKHEVRVSSLSQDIQTDEKSVQPLISSGDTTKPKEAEGIVEDQVDSEAEALELKERLRQEQIAKAKQAEERKKKRAERSELKAQARAKKEEERKEKEREKKAQKKVSSSASGVAHVEDDEQHAEEAVVSKAAPPDNVEDTTKKAATNIVDPSSNKRRKGVVVRRKVSKELVKGPLKPPRFAKKSTLPIPLWACISIAAVSVLVLLAALFLRA